MKQTKKNVSTGTLYTVNTASLLFWFLVHKANPKHFFSLCPAYMDPPKQHFYTSLQWKTHTFFFSQKPLFACGKKVQMQQKISI